MPLSSSNKKYEAGSLGVKSAAAAGSPSRPPVSMGSLGLKSANAGNKRPFSMMNPMLATPTFNNTYSPANVPYSSTSSLQSQLQFQMELQRALMVIQMQTRQTLFSQMNNGSHLQFPQNMLQINMNERSTPPPSSQALASLLQQRNMNANVNVLRPPQPPQQPTIGRFVDVSALNRNSKRTKVAKQTVQKNTTSSSAPKKKRSSKEATTATTSSKNGRRGRQTMGRWTDEEHARFLQGLETYGSHDWRSVAGVVETRTIVQVRTHAQKYFQKVDKVGSQSCAGFMSGSASSGDDEVSVAGSSESGLSGIRTPQEAVVRPYLNGCPSPCMSPSLVTVQSVEHKRRVTPSFSFNKKNNNTNNNVNNNIKNNINNLNNNNNNLRMKAPVDTSALSRLASIALSELVGM